MKIYKYNSYEDYVEAQTEANVRKLNLVWVNSQTIDIVHNHNPFASTILCHGTRNAAEQKLFKEKYPAAEILGTEISYTATKFPMTIQLDFHEQKPEWIGKWDIIYSNSFDHSYDPVKCMSTWADQLSNKGSLCIEAMLGDNNRSKRSDPLEINESELIDIALSKGMRYKTAVDTRGTSKSKIYIFTK